MSFGVLIESRTVHIGSIKKLIRLDRRVWNGLDEICERESLTMDQLVTQAVRTRPDRPVREVLETLAVMYFWNSARQSRSDDPSVVERDRGKTRH